LQADTRGLIGPVGWLWEGSRLIKLSASQGTGLIGGQARGKPPTGQKKKGACPDGEDTGKGKGEEGDEKTAQGKKGRDQEKERLGREAGRENRSKYRQFSQPSLPLRALCSPSRCETIECHIPK